jgi:HK97 family phage prohead protease
MQTFNLNIPISKVDEEQRIVYGYATKEELDRQGDIVDYAASKKAFGAWAGNIREQHDAKRVIGKKVSMEFDDANKQILVGAYVSKSPDGENAWTKVKEGLFTGFSIGGKIKSIVKENLTKDGVTSTANRIMDYDLSELSLVDVPACPSAQFVMVKSVNGNTKEVEEMHQAPDGMALPWFTKAYAYAPDQVNYLSKSTDNESMKKESKEKSMTNEVKEVEKAVAVHAGEARDENAKDVVPEIAGMDEAEAKAHVADQKDPATAAVAVPAEPHLDCI